MDLNEAKLFLEDGANVEERDEWGFTPLFNACSRKQLEVARLLLENGADVDKEVDDHETPLHVACKKVRAVVFGC
jgi:ankyrin repeat protein